MEYVYRVKSLVSAETCMERGSNLYILGAVQIHRFTQILHTVW